MSDKPYLTLVDPSSQPELDDEFAPLPYYPWDERPPTLPLSQEEAATALHLAHGDVPQAAELLKTPHFRLARVLRQSPRLQHIQREAYGLVLDRAASVPIRTLFNPSSDQRALEWASTKVLQSRLAQGHPLSPAPPQPSAAQASLQINPNRSITFRWRTDADDLPTSDE